MATPAKRPLSVLIIGGGVIGLSCAVELLTHGHSVSLLSRSLPSHAVDALACSAKAGAHWFSFAQHDEHNMQALDMYTYNEFARLCVAAPDCGLFVCRSTALFTHSEQPPHFASKVKNFRALTEGELAAASHGDKRYVYGFSFDSFMINPCIYLPWLERRVAQLGGIMNIGTVDKAQIQPLTNQYDYVVNCTGLASADLFDDCAVYATRGRTVLAADPLGLIKAIWRERTDTPVYILPRFDGTVVLGGSYEDDSYDVSTGDHERAAAIVAKCVALRPEVARMRVSGHSAGVRPNRRGGVRIQADERTAGVIHCYGHAGAGFQSSWGSAVAVRKLMTEKTKARL